MNSTKNEIFISKPYVEEREDDLYRVCANITLEGETHLLFVEVEKEYKDYLVTERSDGFLFLVLPIALREGYNIRCEAPVTAMFLHNIETILIPALLKADERAQKFEIIATNENTPLPSAGGIGASVTCGVDSTYTIMNYTKNQYQGMDLTHLLIGSLSGDLWNFNKDDNLRSWERQNPGRFERYYEISEYTGLPIVKLFTNFAQFMTKRREINEWYRHVHLHIFLTLGAILTVKKLFKTYVFSSTYDYSEFKLKDHLTLDIANYELLLMHILSTPEFMCFSGGASIHRMDKTLELTEYPLAQKSLHPCLRNGKKNCSRPECSKCLRELLTLDYFDKLDDMSEVYDLKKYKEKRQDYLIALIAREEETDFKLLYEMYESRYTDEMRETRIVYNKRQKVVSKSQFDDLNLAYDTLLLVLNTPNFKEILIQKIKEQNIKRVYYAGTSKFGNKIMELIQDEVEIVNLRTGNVNTCDAAFIGTISANGFSLLKDGISKKLKKDINIYSITDIKKLIEDVTN